MNQKNQKGITLIALVITIIVLLILAGVTISMVLGDDGIIAQAQEAKKAQESGTGRDEGAISQAEGILSYYNMEKYDASKNGGIAKQNSTINGEKASSTNPVIPKGFKHLLGTVDEGFVIQDEAGNEFVWIPVDGTNVKLELDSDFGTIGTEPSVHLQLPWGTNADADELNRKAILEDGYENTIDGLLKQFTDEYNSMVKSVTKYGGFYVGRYETGWSAGGGVVMSKPGTPMDATTELKSAWTKVGTSNDNNQATWYGLYAKQKELYKNNSSSSVVSAMIYGCQWDAIMNWMLLDENTSAIVTNCDGMGWHNDNKQNNPEGLTGFDYTGVNNKVKNIYDLAGNNKELTQELLDDGYFRTARGTSTTEGNNASAAQRESYPTVDAYEGYASRLQLYIK